MQYSKTTSSRLSSDLMMIKKALSSENFDSFDRMAQKFVRSCSVPRASPTPGVSIMFRVFP